MRQVTIGELTLSNDLPFVLIAGPCAMESRDHAIEMATALKEMCEKLGLGLIFKTSFDKGNRTSVHSSRGIGMDMGLSVFDEIRSELGCRVITDVHEAQQCAAVAEVVDVLQIPAFLCRQTDLLLAAGQTGKAINVKKGQFLSPHDMAHVAAKIASTGNEEILLCERGTSFGYNTLVNDMRALPIMAETGYPIIFDATHSVQQPGGQGNSSGGQREFVAPLARAALAIGVAGLFVETHQDPDKAPSDGPNMIPLKQMPNLLGELTAFDELAKSQLAAA
ncbi:MAG: 3-deoxy-8-phosphooctulonate synthase [Pseudomonadota bacterium]